MPLPDRPASPFGVWLLYDCELIVRGGAAGARRRAVDGERPGESGVGTTSAGIGGMSVGSGGTAGTDGGTGVRTRGGAYARGAAK